MCCTFKGKKKKKRAAVTEQKLDYSNRELAQHLNCSEAWHLLPKALCSKELNTEQIQTQGFFHPLYSPTNELDHPKVNGSRY